MVTVGMRSSWVVAASLLVSLAGCSPQPTTSTSTAPAVTTDDIVHMDGHGEAGHKHAETYAEAVTMLTGFRDQIRDAFAKGNVSEADPVVHEIGHALEDVTMLAKKASLSEEAQTEIGVTVEKLLDAYGAIDEKIHNNETVDYQQSAAEIDAAMETLAKHVDAAK